MCLSTKERAGRGQSGERVERFEGISLVVPHTSWILVSAFLALIKSGWFSAD